MGAWGYRAFDNDTANDWAYDLEGVTDLSLVESALEEVETIGGAYLDADIATVALAACEVLARCQGNPGYTDAYTEKVDLWVAKHPQKPSAELLARASRAMNRILGADSELRELWEEVDDADWRSSVEDLRQRLRAPSE